MKLYQRSKLVQTAAALNGVPSWNLTPSRSLNVHDLAVVRSAPSSSARPGCGLGRPRLQGDERLEDLRDHAERLAVRDERAVEHDRVGSAGEDERAACLCRRSSPRSSFLLDSSSSPPHALATSASPVTSDNEGE